MSVLAGLYGAMLKFSHRFLAFTGFPSRSSSGELYWKPSEGHVGASLIASRMHRIATELPRRFSIYVSILDLAQSQKQGLI
jgi:hypothetical protein